jgi:low affinity Fe/Cu permease
MNNGIANVDDKNMGKPNNQPQVASSGANRKAAKPKNDADSPQLPALVEFAYSISTVMVIFISLLVALVSFINGSNLKDLVIRTAVTILVTGVLFMLISWQVSSDALKASLKDLEEQKEKDDKERAEKEKEEQERQDREREVMEREERERVASEVAGASGSVKTSNISQDFQDFE